MSGVSSAPVSSKTDGLLLSVTGGLVDACGFLTLGGLFVSHMTGNTTSLAVAFGQGHWLVGWPHLFAIPFFVLGVFLGYRAILASRSLRRCGLILLVEAALLTIFATALLLFGELPRNTAGFYLMAIPPLLAMGMQNSTLRQIGRSAFPSTYMTGVLDTIGRAAADLSLNSADKSAIDQSKGALMIYASYLSGALLGSAGLYFLGYGIFLLPIGLLIVAAARLLRAQPQS